MCNRMVRRAFPICIAAAIAGLCGSGHGGELPARAPADPGTAAPAVAADRAVTFTRDVAPILFANCAPCHRPGEVAPFSLLSYADAVKHADGMAEETRKHHMPPWLPDRGDFPIVGERRLTDAQIATIQQWVGGGKPEGAAADLPPRPVFPDGWQLGRPDIVVSPS